jgi:hypothetical protein
MQQQQRKQIDFRLFYDDHGHLENEDRHDDQDGYRQHKADSAGKLKGITILI